MTVNEWAEDFKSYLNELQMPRDDYKGIMSYIDDALVLLKEQEAEITFLKEMQLQTIHNMSNEDIGNAARNVLRL